MGHILVVEDDSSISEQIRMLLEAQGYTVEVADAGNIADDALMRRDFSLLMLDWDLPGISGVQVCKNYRARGGLAPVLMLTGKDELESKEAAFDAGADDYITKPFALREVAARVKAMVRRTDTLTQSFNAQLADLAQYETGGDMTKDPYIGTMFAGKYKLQEVLGEGGSGIVYGALHVGLNRPVAVKFLHSYLISREEARARFQREARALSEIEHPNIVKVYDYGIERGQPYMVLEKLHGIPLSFMLQDSGPVPPVESVAIFRQICHAMTFAHLHSILHRDLKPENVILLPPVEGKQRIKLVDLGLAKNLNEESDITDTGVTIGTAEYMSPEQCAGKPLDERSDVYSMGCLMYETLTGKPPFTGGDYMKIFRSHVNEKPTPFANVIGGHAPAVRLEKLVLKALEKDPAQRQQSFNELQKELT